MTSAATRSCAASIWKTKKRRSRNSAAGNAPSATTDHLNANRLIAPWLTTRFTGPDSRSWTAPPNSSSWNPRSSPTERPVDEFLADDRLQRANTGRRDFLKFMGFSVTAATLAACETPVVKSIPYTNKPEEITPGVANYYASTYYDGHDYVDVLVKTREGRPIFVKSNTETGVWPQRARQCVRDRSLRQRPPSRLPAQRCRPPIGSPSMLRVQKAMAGAGRKVLLTGHGDEPEPLCAPSPPWRKPPAWSMSSAIPSATAPSSRRPRRTSDADSFPALRFRQCQDRSLPQRRLPRHVGRHRLVHDRVGQDAPSRERRP